MPSARALVVANWKMNASVAGVERFAAAWRDPPQHVDAVVCPPLGYLHRLAQALRGRAVRFGAQNIAAEQPGAFTGEHAATMARDLGAEFAIVGHSERRRLFAESDDVVARKFAVALSAGLAPILCVGETLAERRRGMAQEAVLAQVDAVIERCGVAEFGHAVLAYEPLWAIGSGESATPEQAQEMHAVLRKHLARAADVANVQGSASSARILYGGSVTAANAAALFAAPDIDGALVGSASLDAAEFAAICSAAPSEASS